MKCQNCGKSEVSFHYSSNINGCLTEKYLCSECAASLGYNMETERMFNFVNAFEGFFPDLNGRGVMLPAFSPVIAYGIPVSIAPQMQIKANPCAGDCCAGCGESLQDNQTAATDELLTKRRELNAQMHIAVENEEFEKAAELRDKLKELENEI